MYKLVVTPEVYGEIDALAQSNPDAAADALVLLEELSGDQAELEDLCVTGNRFQYHPPFEVKRLELAVAQGYNIYILKYRDDLGGLPAYRILVGYHSQRGTYYALAFTHRSIAYDQHDVAYRSLRDRYDECGIPSYR